MNLEIERIKMCDHYLKKEANNKKKYISSKFQFQYSIQMYLTADFEAKLI